MQLRLAAPADAAAICALLNRAYRGTQGWTNESALVAGKRASVEDISQSICTADSRFLVYKAAGKIVACICLEHQPPDVCIGSFAVSPELQAAGLGSAVLKAAEQYARRSFQPSQFLLSVLSTRSELIAFYQRRGYALTGNRIAFPAHLDVGTPLLESLSLDELAKPA